MIALSFSWQNSPHLSALGEFPYKPQRGSHYTKVSQRVGSCLCRPFSNRVIGEYEKQNALHPGPGCSERWGQVTSPTIFLTDFCKRYHEKQTEYYKYSKHNQPMVGDYQHFKVLNFIYHGRVPCSQHGDQTKYIRIAPNLVAPIKAVGQQDITKFSWYFLLIYERSVYCATYRVYEKRPIDNYYQHHKCLNEIKLICLIVLEPEKKYISVENQTCRQTKGNCSPPKSVHRFLSQESMKLQVLFDEPTYGPNHASFSPSPFHGLPTCSTGFIKPQRVRTRLLLLLAYQTQYRINGKAADDEQRNDNGDSNAFGYFKTKFDWVFHTSLRGLGKISARVNVDYKNPGRPLGQPIFLLDRFFSTNLRFKPPFVTTCSRRNGDLTIISDLPSPTMPAQWHGRLHHG